MNTTQHRSWTTRAAALGLGLAVLGGIFAAATPAQAAPTHWVSGTVLGEGEDGQFSPLEGADVAPFKGAIPTPTEADGSFTLPFEDGSYEITVSAPGYVTRTIPVEVDGVDVSLDDIELSAEQAPAPAPVPTPSPTPVPTPTPTLPAVPAGNVVINGDVVVGSVLTADVAGWPADAELSYQWGYSGGEFGGPIDGATSKTFTVTSDELDMFMVVLVTATAEGLEPTTVSAFTETTVTAAPVEAAAPAPVANSTQLAAYLASKGATTQPQTSAGLPAGALNPGTSYSAKLEWANTTDSFVDVYLYSTPTFLGSFAVVDGVTQINLDAKVLAKLAAGDHTLVVTGQTSGAVQSVAVKLAPAPSLAGSGARLAETGFEGGVPLTAAVFLLLAGGALVFARRRHASA